jgi:transposase
MESPSDLAQMTADELRDLAASLIQRVTQQSQVLQFRELKIEQLTHEMATLKRGGCTAQRVAGRRAEKPVGGIHR